MFNCGGEKIYLKKVETLLLRDPAVVQAIVLTHAHPTKGECPLATAVINQGNVDEADLKAFTLTHGPAYADPRRILIKDALPLTGVNKVDISLIKPGWML